MKKWLAIWQLQREFPLFALRKHGYVVARSGSGKSELICLILMILKYRLFRFPFSAKINRKRTIFLLDPHGDLADKCARLNLFAEDTKSWGKKGKKPNLLFITAESSPLPTLNPFEAQGIGKGNSGIDVLAQFLTHAFAAMLGHSRGQLSSPMKTFLIPMISVLLSKSKAEPHKPMTFSDLSRFFHPERNHDLVGFGRSQLRDKGQRTFFEAMFHDPQFAATKFALKSRLAYFLNLPMFNRLLNAQRSSWNILKLFGSGKTVIINASKSHLGSEVCEIYGRTITALLQAAAFLSYRKKKFLKRPSENFFLVDEAANFISDDVATILSESRKFGLHMVLVNQLMRQNGMSRELHETIMGNTAIKILGSANYATRRVFAQECDADPDMLRDLRTGQFVVAIHGKGIEKISLPKYWLGDQQSVSFSKWKQIEQHVKPKHFSVAVERKSTAPTRALPPWHFMFFLPLL